jgi:deaminated glutathione amidase
VGTVRAAAVQLATSLDVEENRRAVVRHVGAAADDGAELIVFPEATMCAFGPGSFDLASVAEALDGPFVETLVAGARRSGATVVAGMFERSADPRRVHNTVVAAGPGGLLGAYRKVHLFDALGACESDRVAAGDPVADGVLTFAVGDLVVGVMTCYDLRFPEMARVLVDAGATVLALPAHWYNGPGKAAVWEALVRARAIESTAYVVAACKPEPECVGRSMVVDPAGEVLAALGGAGDGLAAAGLSGARVAEVRSALPVLEHRRYRVVPGR